MFAWWEKLMAAGVVTLIVSFVVLLVWLSVVSIQSYYDCRRDGNSSYVCMNYKANDVRVRQQ